MLVPTTLLLVTLLTSNYDQRVMLINIPIWLITVVAKFPFMERVRLFGINSTPGVDDESGAEHFCSGKVEVLKKQ